MGFLWRCPHKHVSFPLVTRYERQLGGAAARPHVTCLDCGKEFWYDWQQMRRVGERRVAPQPTRPFPPRCAPAVAHDSPDAA